MIIPNLMPLYSYMKTVWCHPHFARGEENIFEQICSNIRVHIEKNKIKSQIIYLGAEIFTTHAQD